jgi:hypothetical protein
MNNKSHSPERLTPEVELKALQRKAKVEYASENLLHNIYATRPHLFKAATQPESAAAAIGDNDTQMVNEGPVTIDNNVEQILKSIEEIHNGYSS